jgi:hypothetical protein
MVKVRGLVAGLGRRVRLTEREDVVCAAEGGGDPIEAYVVAVVEPGDVRQVVGVILVGGGEGVDPRVGEGDLALLPRKQTVQCSGASSPSP